jgi:hypothetical protein
MNNPSSSTSFLVPIAIAVASLLLLAGLVWALELLLTCLIGKTRAKKIVGAVVTTWIVMIMVNALARY